MQRMQNLLGSLWYHWFSDSVVDSVVIPRQAALLLLQALERMRQHYVELEGVSQIASGAYVVLTAEAKKRKAVHTSVS